MGQVAFQEVTLKFQRLGAAAFCTKHGIAWELAACKTLGSTVFTARGHQWSLGDAYAFVSIVQQRCETRAIAALLRVTTTPLADTTALQLHSRVAAHG